MYWLVILGVAMVSYSGPLVKGGLMAVFLSRDSKQNLSQRRVIVFDF